jgi:phosphopantothenate-cysteine ligase
MNILITAGGNTEKIDEVRMIRNTGTGRLGALIAENLLASCADAHVFYLCDRHAVTPAAPATSAAPAKPAAPIAPATAVTPAAPASDRVTVVHAGNVTALEAAVRKVCAENHIDAVVHSMAVSDYRVKNVTTAMNAADAAEFIHRESSKDGYDYGRVDGAIFHLWSFLKKHKPGKMPWITRQKLAEHIANAKDVREGGKISSDLDDVLVVLERAPKIIALYRGLAPDAGIVGFKLLADVSEDELIGVGYNLLKKNDCDYVLANDTKYLSSGGHIGHLIARDGSYETYDGKTAIAGAIAAAVSSGAARL